MAERAPGNRHSCAITLLFDTEQEAVAVERSLAPEMGEPIQRARTTMRREGQTLTLAIEAEDIASLRAALNSHLRLAKTAMEIASRLG